MQDRRDPVEVHGADQQPRESLLVAAARPQEPVQVLLREAGALCGLAAQRLQRGQLALARDHLFDARHAERPDQLVLEVDDAHPDAVLGTGRRAMAQRPGEPRGLPEVAQPTEAHTAPRPPPDVVADVRRTAHRDHRDPVGGEVVAAAAGQLGERGAIAHALDQHDGARQDLLRHVPIVPFRSP